MLALSPVAGGDVLIRSLDHHAVFLLLAQLAILLFAARLLGEVARKLGQPAVVGELMAGVVLGPSLFGLLLPELQAATFPRVQHQADLLAVVGWLGVLFLLVVTGLETDLGLIKRRGRSALIISAGGISVPLVTGFILGWLLPDQFLADPEKRLVFALFIAVAMSISAVPVIAKVLMDLKLVRRDIGQLILAAAMTDDTVGWILLSVVAGLATAGSINFLAVVTALGGAGIFLAAAFTVGGFVVSRIITATDVAFGSTNAQISVVLVLALGTAALTHYLGIEAVLGAFVVGVLVAQAPRFRQDVAHSLEGMASAFLAPIFFASAGLKVDLLRMTDPTVLVAGGVVLTVACVGKFVGAYIGSGIVGVSHWERLATGAGLNARGAMEIVVATVGLGLGILSVEMYSIIVMIAIVTSLMAPPLLRFTLSRVSLGADEAARLEREELAATSFIRGVRRVLVIGRTPRIMRIPAQMIAHMSRAQPLEATGLLSRPPVAPGRWWWPFGATKRRARELTRNASATIREQAFAAMQGPVDVKLVTDRDRVHSLVALASRRYDLAIVCDVRRSPGLSMFAVSLDQFLREAPCPVIVVRSPRDAAPAVMPWSPRKILVPTVGNDRCKHAVEVAAVLAASTDASLVILHVVRPTRGTDDTETTIGQEIVDGHANWARRFGARTETLVFESDAGPAEAIITVAREQSADLLLLGRGLRVAKSRAFFGHRVARILDEAPCPVAIVTVT